jgi:hypothetical protein
MQERTAPPSKVVEVAKCFALAVLGFAANRGIAHLARLMEACCARMDPGNAPSLTVRAILDADNWASLGLLLLIAAAFCLHPRRRFDQYLLFIAMLELCWLLLVGVAANAPLIGGVIQASEPPAETPARVSGDSQHLTR